MTRDALRLYDLDDIVAELYDVKEPSDDADADETLAHAHTEADILERRLAGLPIRKALFGAFSAGVVVGARRCAEEE